MSEETMFADLELQQQNTIVDICMALLREMTEAFGIEKGEALYNGIADVCGPDVKGAVMFAMLTGHHGQVILQSAVSVTQYVELIKVVRQYTGFGLKEAKDACDLARSGRAVKFNVSADKRRDFVNAMRAIQGVVVS